MEVDNQQVNEYHRDGITFKAGDIIYRNDTNSFTPIEDTTYNSMNFHDNSLQDYINEDKHPIIRDAINQYIQKLQKYVIKKIIMEKKSVTEGFTSEYRVSKDVKNYYFLISKSEPVSSEPVSSEQVNVNDYANEIEIRKKLWYKQLESIINTKYKLPSFQEISKPDIYNIIYENSIEKIKDNKHAIFKLEPFCHESFHNNIPLGGIIEQKLNEIINTYRVLPIHFIYYDTNDYVYKYIGHYKSGMFYNSLPVDKDNDDAGRNTRLFKARYSNLYKGTLIDYKIDTPTDIETTKYVITAKSFYWDKAYKITELVDLYTIRCELYENHNISSKLLQYYIDDNTYITGEVKELQEKYQTKKKDRTKDISKALENKKKLNQNQQYANIINYFKGNKPKTPQGGKSTRRNRKKHKSKSSRHRRSRRTKYHT